MLAACSLHSISFIYIYTCTSAAYLGLIREMKWVADYVPFINCVPATPRMAADSGVTQLRSALWLQPKPGSQLHTVLRQTIAGLAPVFDDAPVFDPHVTIVSGINVHSQEDIDFVLDGAIAAAKSVPHVDVRLGQVTYGRLYFRKVVLEAETSPELLSLAAIAKEEYVLYPQIKAETVASKSLSNEQASQEASEKARAAALHWLHTEFKPHLSLVYSGVYPVSEAVQHTVHQRLRDVFGPHYETRGLGWTGGQIALVSCEGPVESWKVLGSRSF